MRKQNTSRYALLGALTWGPMSGYDIKKAIENSVGNFWQESYGQIYPLLKTLVAEGMATQAHAPQTGKPDKTVYTITEKGHAVLQQWLMEPAAADHYRIELLLRLFFGRQTGVTHNRQQIAHYRTVQEGLLLRYQAIEERLNAGLETNPDYHYYRFTVRYGLHVSQGLVAWCDETLAALDAQTKPDTDQG